MSVKLSFRELCDSNLSSLRPFDNLDISLSSKEVITRKAGCEFMRH